MFGLCRRKHVRRNYILPAYEKSSTLLINLRCIKQESVTEETQMQTAANSHTHQESCRSFSRGRQSGDFAFHIYAPCLASNGEQQLAMWVAWLQWIAAQLMQDLVNVTLIVKPVSIQLWQYTENWKEELSRYEQLLDAVSFPVFPPAKVDSILVVRSLKLGFRWLASCHFQTVCGQLTRNTQVTVFAFGVVLV